MKKLSSGRNRLISHIKDTVCNLEHKIERIKANISAPEEVSKKIKLLEDLNEFPLGQFLLTHHGLNGYWTACVILHGIHQPNLSALESWLLHHAPGIKATRERFYIF